MINLNGENRRKLCQALMSAYPSITKLKMMVSYELDRNLDSIAGGSNLEEFVFSLINTAETEEWLEKLIRGARNANQGNTALRTVAEELLSNSSNQQQKILILAAIPDGLDLGKEIWKIQSAIERASNRDIFEIKIRTAVCAKDIRRAIAKEKPQIVHFCGHGEEDGSLRLEDDGGNDKPVAPEALASLFKLHVDYVKCVVLNACHSEKPAQAISQYINYVIGMNNSIIDNAAIVFSEGFYDGLGYNISNQQDMFQRAFDEGVVAIQMENPSQASIPVLKKKE